MEAMRTPLASAPTAQLSSAPVDPLAGHVGLFQTPHGPDLLGRTLPFSQWLHARRHAGVWPYSRVLTQSPAPRVAMATEDGCVTTGLNFSSQDYLSLCVHPAVLDAAVRAVRDYGPHSAGSAVLSGNTSPSIALERELSTFLNREHVVLFPTGWAAGFGAISGLIRAEDHVLLDRRAHACLQQGARAATTNTRLFKHLSVESCRELLQEIRAHDSQHAILVVTEGLFSMDSDSPDLRAFQAVSREYDATLLVDVAHDLGATGPSGTGQLGAQGVLDDVDLIMGSFSKTFASNGGFLACKTRAVRDFVEFQSGPHTFSNALSPIQASVVNQSLAIVRSREGTERRAANHRAAEALRRGISALGFECAGETSPIVPVLVPDMKLARLVSAELPARGLLANLVEYPAVPIHGGRFRFQVMADHTEEDAETAAGIFAEGVAISQRRMGQLTPAP